MQIRAVIPFVIGLLLMSLPVFVSPAADAGVTRTPIEGWDNWGWQGGPQSSPTIICPGGELAEIPFPCSDSMTDRVHLRGGAGWSCMTSNDPRMTGIGLYTSNANYDADGSGPAWGEWKVVPMVGCNKDAVFSEAYEDFVNDATRFWYGTWHGRRQFDSDNNVWISEFEAVTRGVGGDLEGLQFKGTMWVTLYTPFPMPYEYIFPYGSEPFDMPEGYVIGTIKE
jgi:hypothetical protein